MPGPLPDPNHRRRNAPKIPTTSLPASGRAGRIPVPPEWAQIGDAGLAWWRWAWRTPQACGWDSGASVMIARRASLEDDLTAGPKSSRLGVMREMRELDDRLGLTPKGLAQLRWTIVDDAPAETGPVGVPRLDDRRQRLTGDAS